MFQIVPIGSHNWVILKESQKLVWKGIENNGQNIFDYQSLRCISKMIIIINFFVTFQIWYSSLFNDFRTLNRCFRYRPGNRNFIGSSRFLLYLFDIRIWNKSNLYLLYHFVKSIFSFSNKHSLTYAVIPINPQSRIIKTVSSSSSPRKHRFSLFFNFFSVRRYRIR